MRAFGFFVYGILLLLFSAFVTTKLWLWFVVPFFRLRKICMTKPRDFSGFFYAQNFGTLPSCWLLWENFSAN